MNANRPAKKKAGVLAKVAASLVLAGADVELGLQNHVKIRLHCLNGYVLHSG